MYHIIILKFNQSIQRAKAMSLAITLMMAGVLFFPYVSSAQTIEVITFEYYPITNADSTGINPHIIKEAFQANGDRAEFVFYPRVRSMKMFENSDTQLFLGEARYFSNTPVQLDAQRFIYFSVALLYKESRFPSLRYSGIKDLSGRIIGVSLGSNLTPVFQKAGWKVEETRHLEFNVRKLVTERIDFWGTVYLTGITYIKDMYPGELHDIGVIEFEKFPLELVAKKNEPSGLLLENFRTGLGKIIENGTYHRILEQYYGDHVPESTPITMDDIQSK